MDFISDYIFWIIFIITIASIFLYKKITKDPNAITAKHITSLDLESQSVKHEDILEAMKSSKFKNAYFNEEDQVFRGTVGFSMSSFFELIEIRLIDSENNQSLTFLSICGLPTQIYDWGKNKRNYKRFLKNLNLKTPNELSK